MQLQWLLLQWLCYLLSNFFKRNLYATFRGQLASLLWAPSRTSRFGPGKPSAGEWAAAGALGAEPALLLLHHTVKRTRVMEYSMGMTFDGLSVSFPAATVG